MRIGIAGLGRMGSALADRLREVGHSLVVWNRTPEKAVPIVDAGAALARSPAELAEQSETIITCLTDAAAIEAVYAGKDGLLAADIQGRLFIETSTVRPETQRGLAERVRAKNGVFVECAVSGTTGPARQGRLIGLAGGEADDIDRARPILEQFCRRIEHAGPVGAGASLKLAVNLPLVVYYQALGEAYALCRHLGLDPERLIDLFADTSGGANILKARGSIIAATLRTGDPPPVTFDIDSVRKDLQTMIAEGKALGFPLPVTERALEIYDEASRSTWGDRDATSMPAFWSGRKRG
jgi:3-hydroxyisobutyrate dehydrogenase